MPSTSKSQEKLMRAAAHSKKFAKKVDVPQSVAREFEKADKKANKSTKNMIKNRYKE